ncbi:MAG: DUF11 domain-containing protein [Actinobacteria bacterium]|nr:DUF11 domain-containing protein [Actinomycetota bacterium]
MSFRKIVSTALFAALAVSIVLVAATGCVLFPPPNLKVSHSAVLIDDADSDGSLSPGDALEYTLTYEHDIPYELDTYMTDDYDETLIAAVTDISGGGVDSSGSTTWDLGPVRPRSPAHTQTYRARLKGDESFPPGDTNLVNSALIEYKNFDRKIEDTHTEIVTRLVPDLEIEMTAALFEDADSDGRLSPGDALEYTLTYRNRGQTIAPDVVLTDDFDEALVGSVTDMSNGGASDSGKITWDLGELPAGSPDYSQTYRARLNGEASFPAGDTDLVNEATILERKTGDSDAATQTEVVTRELATTGLKVLGSKGWLLAEGSTGGGFDTWILLQNPGTVKANAEVTFMTEAGSQAPVPVPMEAESRATIRISDYVPNNFQVSTMVTSDVPIMADRSIYWDKRFSGEGSISGSPQPYEMKSGHSNIGTPLESISARGDGTGRITTYIPEGSTAGGFDTWILLCNPNGQEANTQLAFTTASGVAAQNTVQVPAHSRRTVHLNEIVPNESEVATEISSDAAILAERSMYWDPNMDNLQPYEARGGHSSSDSASPAREWFIAEGSTGAGFETYILVQNPQDGSADVVATFMNDKGVAAEKGFSMMPHSRATLRVSDYVPNEFDVSTKITANQDVVAERSMYWDKLEVQQTYEMRDGHSSTGVSSLGATWMIAEGSTGTGFDTWILLSNPGDSEADTAVTFMNAEGPLAPINVKIPPRSRKTIRINDYVPDDFNVSTLIESNTPLVAERSMYWDKREASGIQPYEMMGGHSAPGLDP